MKNKIFALDVNNVKTLLNYVRELSRRNDILEDIYAIKIGTLNIIDEGLSIINKIKKITNLPIICDLKLAEIPCIAGEIARKVAEAGAYGIVVQGFVGEKAIDQILDIAPNLKIFLVSEMTHNDGGFTYHFLNEFVILANMKRVCGIIGPGNRPQRLEQIRRLLDPQIKLVAAGISNQQGGEEKAAILAGADLLIEGTKLKKRLSESVIRRQNKQFLAELLIYVVSGLLLGAVIVLLGQRFDFIGKSPWINVIVGSFFAILGAILKYWRKS
ncbi:MAG: orotidine 5'-phosphate decarboxylase [Syntrophobacterales bacterium]|jgi:orotidine-5'-phosphate decarboxylase|nr:orotidine 5'-phosphate decarboxylase [Syntrophobacterales bacterium]